MGGAIATTWSRDPLARPAAAGERGTGLNLLPSYLVRDRAEEVEHRIDGSTNSNLVTDGEEVTCRAEHDAGAAVTDLGFVEEQADATFTGFEQLDPRLGGGNAWWCRDERP